MKTCRRCGEAKPVEDFAAMRKTEPDKRHSICRPCAVQVRYEWSIANPDKVAAYKRKDRESGKEAKRSKRWREANPEKVKAAKRRHYDLYATHYREAAARYRQEHPEKAKAAVVRWLEENPERAAEIRYRGNRRRRAKLAGAFIEDVDPLVVLEMDDGVCGICGEDVDPFSFELDHGLPIARGGLHAYSNVQVAHASCNRSKGATI